MQLKLQKQAEKAQKVFKGDIIVMTKDDDKDYLAHYLVVRDEPKNQYTIINMSGNMLMSVRTTLLGDLLDAIKNRFPQLELVEIIPADQFEVVRKA